MSELSELTSVLTDADKAATAVAAEATHLLAAQASGIQVAVVNHATALQDADVKSIVAALQIQVTRDFYGSPWGINAHVFFTQIPSETAWQLVFFDDADQAGALGYHDVTPTGLPLGKVFVKTAQAASVAPSGVASHELLEMAADPWINVLIQDASNPNRFWIREDGDPVESDSYQINGVEMSNFVLPAYFEPDLKLAGPFDFLRKLTGPLPAMTPGGYLSYYENGQWSQIFGRDHAPTPGRAGGSGRLARRMAGQNTWTRSTTPVLPIDPVQTA